YEHLSPAAIQAAKLFWFDSIGCALGGSQQDDAKILLKHYRAMSGREDGDKRDATAFVSGFKTNPVDAAFLNGHMIRAMDYNDIYWKADHCHPSDLIAAPLALCESEGLSGKDLILATIIAYEIEMRFCEIGGQGEWVRRARFWLARVFPVPSTSSMARRDCSPCSITCSTRDNQLRLIPRRWSRPFPTQTSLTTASLIAA